MYYLLELAANSFIVFLLYITKFAGLINYDIGRGDCVLANRELLCRYVCGFVVICNR